MTSNRTSLSRRRLLATGAAALLAGYVAPFVSAEQTVSNEHDNFISPRRLVPDFPVRGADGKTAGLHSLLQGRATAVQFIFTECHTVCPIQGAIFQKVQGMLPSKPAQPVQLLSLSIDPDTDSPAMLKEWLGRYHAGPGWTAATPAPDAVTALRSFFGDGSPVARHTTQVHLIDSDGRWFWRTYNLPSAETVAALLTQRKSI